MWVCVCACACMYTDKRVIPAQQLAKWMYSPDPAVNSWAAHTFCFAKCMFCYTAAHHVEMTYMPIYSGAQRRWSPGSKLSTLWQPCSPRPHSQQPLGRRKSSAARCCRQPPQGCHRWACWAWMLSWMTTTALYSKIWFPWSLALVLLDFIFQNTVFLFRRMTPSALMGDWYACGDLSSSKSILLYYVFMFLGGAVKIAWGQAEAHLHRAGRA